jgi:hypothetical protein
MPVVLPEIPATEPEKVQAAQPEVIQEAAATPEPEVVQAVTETPEPEIIPEPAVEPAAVDPVQDLWQKLLECSGDMKELLETCTPVSLINSVLTIQAPAPTAAALRENRLKLLTLLQQASGNWAILPDVQSVPVQTTEVVPPPAAAPVAEPTAVEENIPEEPAAPAVSGTVQVPEMPEGTTVEDNFEEFIELTAIEDMPEDMAEFSREDLGYSKRSVIHDPSEIEATAKLPPVQKVLDLFGGEIVDIHA